MSETESQEINETILYLRRRMDYILKLAAGEPIKIELPVRIPSGPITVSASTESINFTPDYYRELSSIYCDFVRTINSLRPRYIPLTEAEKKNLTEAQQKDREEVRTKAWMKLMIKSGAMLCIAYNNVWDKGWPGPQFAEKFKREVRRLYDKDREGVRRDHKMLIFTDTSPEKADRGLPARPRGEKAGWEPTGAKEKRLFEPADISADISDVNPAGIELFPPELINQLLYNLRHVPLTPGEKRVAVAVARGPRVRHCDAAEEQDVSKAAISRMVARLRGKIPRETLLP